MTSFHAVCAGVYPSVRSMGSRFSALGCMLCAHILQFQTHTYTKVEVKQTALGRLETESSLLSWSLCAGVTAQTGPTMDRVLGILEAKSVSEYSFNEGTSGNSSAVGSTLKQLGSVSTSPGVLPGGQSLGYGNYLHMFQPSSWPLDPI